MFGVPLACAHPATCVKARYFSFIISEFCTIDSMETSAIGRRLAPLMLATAAFGASPEEFSTAAGTLQIVPIQHASLIVKAAGKVLYIDPAQGSYDGLPAADYILITDIHGDHMAPPIVDKLKTPATLIKLACWM